MSGFGNPSYRRTLMREYIGIRKSLLQKNIDERICRDSEIPPTEES